MSTTTFNGVKVMVGSDPYALTADMLTLAKSLNLEIPVNNDTERNALPAYEGMKVTRMDRGGAVEIYLNAGWKKFENEHLVTLGPGWSNIAGTIPLRVEVGNSSASLNGFITRASGTGLVVGTIPADARPVRDVTFSTTAQNPSTTVGPNFRLYISAASGAITILRLEPATPAWNNTTTQIPINATWMTR